MIFNYLPSRNIVVLLFRKKLVLDNSLTFKICFICACPCYGIRDTIKTICPRRAKAGFLKTIQLHFLEMFLLVIIVSYSFLRKLTFDRMTPDSSSRSVTEKGNHQSGPAQPAIVSLSMGARIYTYLWGLGGSWLNLWISLWLRFVLKIVGECLAGWAASRPA